MFSLLRFPRPRSFLHIISLRTATEFIVFTLALNKITGLYGFLALFTGYDLNPLQLSHYIYSLLVLALLAYLHPSIRQKDEVLRNMALAWLYVLDTIVNSVYTIMFGTGWFVLLAQHLNDPVGPTMPGQGTMNDTSGFTNPEVEASKVEVVATPSTGILPGQEATAFAIQGGSDTLGNAVFQSGSIASITVIGFLWLVRIYFCIVIMSYARSLLRRYVAVTSTANYNQPEDAGLAENPFRAGREEGNGVAGRLGRAMVALPSKKYWLGRDESEEWVRATSGRFEGASLRPLRVRVPSEPGVGERERRARRGTGPPQPPASTIKEAEE